MAKIFKPSLDGAVDLLKDQLNMAQVKGYAVKVSKSCCLWFIKLTISERKLSWSAALGNLQPCAAASDGS
jgi:hypothetical protein